MSILCQVFKSKRKQEMYLFVEMSRGLQSVPEVLLAQFGNPIPVMSLKLTAESKLARADARAVLASIKEQGFYLQMPPTTDLEKGEYGC